MSTIDIVPELNLGIEKCINGTPQRNSVFLCVETDFVLSYQTTRLPYPKQLFDFIAHNQNIGIVRE